MYYSFVLSLACLAIACCIGLIYWMTSREVKRHKREREEKLKRRVQELTGQDFVKGHTTVKDLERMFGKKG